MKISCVRFFHFYSGGVLGVKSYSCAINGSPLMVHESRFKRKLNENIKILRAFGGCLGMQRR